MKKQHGVKKYKCNYCNFRSDNQSNLKKHEKAKHENELFKCEQCEYKTPRKDKIRQHTRSKHLEKKNCKKERAAHLCTCVICVYMCSPSHTLH